MCFHSPLLRCTGRCSEFDCCRHLAHCRSYILRYLDFHRIVVPQLPTPPGALTRVAEAIPLPSPNSTLLMKSPKAGRTASAARSRCRQRNLKTGAGIVPDNRKDIGASQAAIVRTGVRAAHLLDRICMSDPRQGRKGYHTQHAHPKLLHQDSLFTLIWGALSTYFSSIFIPRIRESRQIF